MTRRGRENDPQLAGLGSFLVAPPPLNGAHSARQKKNTSAAVPSRLGRLDDGDHEGGTDSSRSAVHSQWKKRRDRRIAAAGATAERDSLAAKTDDTQAKMSRPTQLHLLLLVLVATNLEQETTLRFC